QVVMFAGYVLYRLPSREGRAQLLRQVQCSAWLIAFYLMVMLVSYLGSFGGIGAIAHPWDTLAVAAIAYAVYEWAARAGLRREELELEADDGAGGHNRGAWPQGRRRDGKDPGPGAAGAVHGRAGGGAGAGRRSVPGRAARTVDRADPRRRLAGHVAGRRPLPLPQDGRGRVRLLRLWARWRTQGAGLRSCRDRAGAGRGRRRRTRAHAAAVRAVPVRGRRRGDRVLHGRGALALHAGAGGLCQGAATAGTATRL